jgi:uncharacterized protein
MADFEWDPNKEAGNIRKHDVDFTTASLIWRESVYERVDNRRSYGEVRLQEFGGVEDRILTVVFTWRGEVRRIISARKADGREKRLLEDKIANPGRPPPD